MGLLKSLMENKFIKTMVCGLLMSGGLMTGMSQADAGAPASGYVGTDTYNVSGQKNIIYDAAIKNYNIYVPKDFQISDYMLKLVPPAYTKIDFGSEVTINAGIEDGSKLKVGNKVTLIKVTGEGIGEFNAATGLVTESDFKKFGLDIYRDENNVIAEITSAPGSDLPGGLTEESKSPVETQAAGLSMLTAGADMLAVQGFDNAETAVASEVSAGGSASTMTPFVAMGGAKTKVKSGSYVDVKGWNLNVGFAKEIKNHAGKLLIGPVIEYGKGSYDSYLDNGYHGEGDTSYTGAGVMAKQTNEDGFYYEGSLRAGKLKNDYKANDNSYDSDSTYIAAHIGAGKILKLSEKNTLDYYGKFFYTHQRGDDTTLHAGGTPYALHFDSVNSNRTRIGARFTHAMSEKDSVYVGLAWQHEFSGTARATIDGAGTPAPSVKGNTGIMEIGWKVAANKNLDLDLGATGSVGKQQGAGLNLSINFKF